MKFNWRFLKFSRKLFICIKEKNINIIVVAVETVLRVLFCAKENHENQRDYIQLLVAVFKKDQR